MNEFVLEENFYIFESVCKKLQELKRILECYTYIVKVNGKLVICLVVSN